MTEHRTRCEVPFCTRSRAGSWKFWLCSDHRKMVSLHARSRHRKAKAYCKKRGWIAVDDKRNAWWPTTARAERIMDSVGRARIRSAIKMATGL